MEPNHGTLELMNACLFATRPKVSKIMAYLKNRVRKFTKRCERVMEIKRWLEILARTIDSTL